MKHSFCRRRRSQTINVAGGIALDFVQLFLRDSQVNLFIPRGSVTKVAYERGRKLVFAWAYYPVSHVYFCTDPLLRRGLDEAEERKLAKLRVRISALLPRRQIHLDRPQKVAVDVVRQVLKRMRVYWIKR